MIAHQLFDGQREQYLSSMPCAQQPGHPAERGTVVVTIALLAGSRVQSHAHAQGASLLPGRAKEGTLRSQCGIQCRWCALEGGIESIAAGFEDGPLMALDG